MITMSLRVFEKQSLVTSGDCSRALPGVICQANHAGAGVRLPDTVPSGTGEVHVSQRALAVRCKAARCGG